MEPAVAIRRRALHGFAVATALGAYLLMIVGGLVRGASTRAMLREVAAHRAAAGAVGLLTVALAVLLAAERARRPGLSRLGWAAVALVAAQALLGGLGALAGLPIAVGALHTGVSLVFFLTVFYVAAQTAVGADRRPELTPAARALTLVAALGVLWQALLGGVIRQLSTALPCGDPRLCGGATLATLEGLHRVGAAGVAVLVFASGIATFRAAAGRPWLRALALAAPVLLAAQVLLGVGSVRTVLDAAVLQAHLAVGAALLAAVWACYLLSAPAAAAAHAGDLRATARALVELTKPRITFLVVFTYAAGVWLAPGAVGGARALLALLGTVLIVGAANALNMYLERDSDGLMSRTRRRPLPQGRVSGELVIGFGAVLALVALPLLLVGSNALTTWLGLLAFASYVWAYTPLKRRTALALWVGAVPGALPPLMGWTATTGRVDAAGLVLFAVLFLWQIPHFLAIAIYRAEEYGRAGIRVLPLVAGARATRLHAVAWTALLVAASLLLVPLRAAGAVYLAGAALLGAGFLAVAARGLRATDDRAWARRLFFTSLLYLPLLFAALGLDRAVD